MKMMSQGNDYGSVIAQIVAAEIVPAAKQFRNKLDGIYEQLFGKIAANVLTYLGGSAGLQLFGDLSWVKLLELAGVAGGALAATAIDAKQRMKAATRECAISYVLGLDKR